MWSSNYVNNNDTLTAARTVIAIAPILYHVEAFRH